MTDAIATAIDEWWAIVEHHRVRNRNNRNRQGEQVTQELHDRIEWDFTNHPPASDRVVDWFGELRDKAKAFAHAVADVCPPGREQSLALTKIEEGLMFSIAAVARHTDDRPGTTGYAEPQPVLVDSDAEVAERTEAEALSGGVEATETTSDVDDPSGLAAEQADAAEAEKSTAHQAYTSGVLG